MYTNGSTRRFARLYAVCAAALLLATVPAALVHLDSVRLAPVALPYTPSPDGTLHVVQDDRLLFLERVSINGAAPLRAAGVAFLRQSQGFPAGTSLVFSGRDSSGRAVTIRGVVKRADAPFERAFQQLVAIVIAVVFAICGLAMAIAAVDERSVLAAAAMSGVAILFGPMLVHSTTVSFESAEVRAHLLELWQLFPRPLALYWLPAFATAFPRRLERPGVAGLLLRTAFVFALAASIMNGLLQLPNVAERLSLAVQRLLLVATIAVQDIGYAVFLAATLAALAAQKTASRRYDRGDKRRGAVVADTVLAGVALPMLLGLVQIASIVLCRRPLIASPLMVASFLTLLLVAPAVAYATHARHVDSIRLLVRRAALFAFTRRTLHVLSLIPLLILAVVLYSHRTQSLVRIVELHPFLIGITIIATTLSLRFAAVVESRLETIFFRDRLDERYILRRLAEAAARIDRLDDLSQLLEAEIDRALHLESVSLFVREPAGERFRARGVPWFLEPTSHVIDELTRTGDFYDVEELAQFDSADEIERLWISEARVRMLVPLRGGTGTLIGFLALGEKRSDLRFDREDRLLLGSIAAAAALAIDNHILRNSPPITPRDPDTGSDNDSPNARYCASCRLVFDGGERRCPTDGGALAEAEIPLVIAGKYRLDSYLGAGGMGVVFRARDLTLGRVVAIKTLPRISTAAAVRFRREARIGAALTHPALAAVFAAETCRGRPLLVLEYLARGTLATRIADGPLPIAAIVTCAIRISEALAALHDAGVLHRDVKPSNIGFAARDEPKLLDFGLARLVVDSTIVPANARSEVGTERLTESSGIAGTPAYLPPEVIVGRRYNPSVDLWGLSMSMYEAVVGGHPFHDSSAVRMMNRIVSEDAPDARLLRRDCPPAIAELFRTSLARSATLRPRDGRALAQAWREAARRVTF